jgi:CDP-diacylglycerol--glycerol-3-phosphate 3-phosphatidyltransferase
MDDLSVNVVALTGGSLDLACSCSVLLVAAMVAGGYAMAALTHLRRRDLLAKHRSVALPRTATAMVHWAIEPMVRALVAADVSANVVTCGALVAAAGGGVALAAGHDGVGAVFLVVASLGDAVDGLVARRGHGESAAGALLDASVDRYAEFFALGGLAIRFRESGLLLSLVLLALMGSFMVSYGSAKAEALRVPVPSGAMRRAERATCLCIGVTLSPLAGAMSRAAGGPPWIAAAPLVVGLVIIGSAANVSAVRRLRAVAACAVPGGRRGASSVARADVGARLAAK